MLGSEFLTKLGELAPLRLNEPMSRHTSLRVGGPADAYVVARSPEQLEALACLAWEHNVPFFLLGAGTNILVSDAGVRGLVIENRARQVERRASEMGLDWVVLRVGSGASLARLAWEAALSGLEGLEWAVGIPGSVGGAVVSNAGAHGGSMGDVLSGVEVVARGGKTFELSKDDLGLGYRCSRFTRDGVQASPSLVILSAGLLLRKGSPQTLRERVTGYNQRRRDTQPALPSAGSIFKNPPDRPAGWLVERAGLKGYRIGKAEISSKHANFIVNRGGARAWEVEALMAVAQERVYQRFGVVLEREVQLVGERL